MEIDATELSNVTGGADGQTKAIIDTGQRDQLAANCTWVSADELKCKVNRAAGPIGFMRYNPFSDYRIKWDPQGASPQN